MLCSLCNAPIDDNQNICPDCKLYALMERENRHLHLHQHQGNNVMKKIRRRYLMLTLCVFASITLIVAGFYTIPYKASYKFSDSSGYVGEVKGFKFNGYGTYTQSDGSKYTGEWKNGKRDGQGTEYDKEGQVINSGEWQDSNFIGQSN